MIQVVTTCNAKGWKQYGRRMVESFIEKWPKEILLTLYAEGFECDIEGVNIKMLPHWHTKFKEKWQHIPDAVGKAHSHYDFRRDCIRFSHKVGAIIDAGESQNNGILIWLDADTYTHSPITVEWLNHLLPEPFYLAWLDRPFAYPECGFLMFRCNHKAHNEIMKRYRMLYETGKVFHFPETHDSFVFQQIIKTAQKDNLIEPPISLSGRAKNTGHPFVACELGAYMDHLKGARKSTGRSLRMEAGNRTEDYWN